MSGKYALIIGNTEYTDPGLARLTAPGKDADDFARVLKDPNLCAFDDVRVLLNQISSTVIEAVDEFFDQRKPDDLLVLFFSGHGVRDELGSLYLAVKNTIRSRLRSTAIKSDYIREVMDQSRSRRQILILDCCNSGAFPQGTKAEVGGTMGMVTAFQGYGRYVLTASDATQFAWEGNRIIGETENSLFTHFLVKGLEGEADADGDGKISVDELYDYAFEEIVRLTPKQKPNKSATRQEGDIILRQITRIQDIRPVSLPVELLEAIDDSRTFVREGAIQELEKLLKGKNLGLARSAREALERIEQGDDSRRVAQAATQILLPLRQAETEQKANEPAERLRTEQTTEVERAEQARAERLAEQMRLAEAKVGGEQEALQRAEQPTRQKSEEHIAKTRVGTERLVKEKQPTVDTPIPIPQKSLGPRPTSQGRSVLRWTVLGLIGLLLLGAGAWGISRYLDGSVSTPTGAPAQGVAMTQPAENTPPTEGPSLRQLGPGEGEVSIISMSGFVERGESDPAYDWVTSFETETGCNVSVQIATTSDEIVSLMRNGGYDLAIASGDISGQLIDEGLVQVINTDLIPSWNTIDDRLKNAPWHTVDEVHHYGVPLEWSPTVLVYNMEIFPEPPTSWNVMFTEMLLSDGESNKGRLEAFEDPMTIADAALYLKYHRPDLGIENPYALDQNQFNAALELLKTQKELVRSYWNWTVQFSQSQMDDFTYGVIIAGSSFPYRANVIQSNGLTPFASTIPQEGTTGIADTIMLHMNAAHPNCAYMWMEHSLSQKVQGDLAAWFNAVPAVPAACQGNELLTDTGCASNGFNDFDKIWFWRTPTSACGNGSNDCVPYSQWVENYKTIISRQ